MRISACSQDRHEIRIIGIIFCMFQVYDWPQVILHLDGDSFFSSVMQAVNPRLRGRAMVTGSERGVATAISPEAKKLGIIRATPIFEIKKRFPQVIIVASDYELFQMFSQKMFTILRKYAPTIEEYSVDEAFADLKGLRRPLNMTYQEIAQAVKHDIESSLGISISVGVSITKSLAKIASNFNKPSGLTLIPGRFIQNYLGKVPIENVWGIGTNTSSYLQKLGIKTALEFASRSEDFVTTHLSRPFFEIWQELRGHQVYALSGASKTSYQSITRSRTFTPATNNPYVLWGRILGHVEEAFIEARRFRYRVGSISLFLKTQSFRYHHSDIKPLTPAEYPHLIKKDLEEAFSRVYQHSTTYRTTGVTISGLEEAASTQGSLFDQTASDEKIKKTYPLIEAGKVHFGSSLYEGRKLQEKKPTHFAIPTMSLTDLKVS